MCFYNFILLLLNLLMANAETIDSSQTIGKASYYHDKFHGRETSNGESYNQNDFTAAHKTLPFNSLLLVTNNVNHRSVVVRVNDRGPFKKSRVIDLTRSAATRIGMVPFGVVPVKIEIMTYLDRLDIDETFFNAGDSWDCYANKIQLKDKTVLIWRTKYWKHAFYMASNLALEYKEDRIAVIVSGKNDNKTFSVVSTEIKSSKEADLKISNFRKTGFTSSTLFRPV